MGMLKEMCEKMLFNQISLGFRIANFIITALCPFCSDFLLKAWESRKEDLWRQRIFLQVSCCALTYF